MQGIDVHFKLCVLHQLYRLGKMSIDGLKQKFWGGEEPIHTGVDWPYNEVGKIHKKNGLSLKSWGISVSVPFYPQEHVPFP
jgi:hypothetical protein